MSRPHRLDPSLPPATPGRLRRHPLTSSGAATSARAGLVALLTIVASPQSAEAANWLLQQGTEEGRPDKPFLPWGFLQIVAEGIVAEPVEGLEAPALQPFEGRYAAFNVLSGDDGRLSFSVRRARIGARGAVPGTDQRVSWFVALEAGDNAMTLDDPVIITDASVTLSSPWGPRLRLGQFKLPTMDETLEAVQLTSDTLNFSPVATRLMLERPIEGDAFVGNAYGFRDVGAQLFDTVRAGDLELTWAAMVSNGRTGSLNDDSGLDLTGRLQLAWVLDERRLHPDRQEVAVFAWGQRGEREVAGDQVTRLRAGGGAHLRLGPGRLRAEAVWADGVLFGGPKPPFPGQPLAVVAEGDAWGYTLLGGLQVLGPFEIDAALSQVFHLPDGGPDERTFLEATLGAQWFISPEAKLMAAFTWRDIDAPQAAGDASTILETVGPRMGLQATVRF